MYVSAPTLDDLMNEVLRDLLTRQPDVGATRGAASEIVGAMLHLQNPRARLSLTETRGKPFSALGELLWYLSGANDLDFIKYYIKKYEDETEDGKTVYGGYGPRLFNTRGQHNQITNVINLLRCKPTSRRAVIQIFDAIDISEPHKEVPCTCALQFLIRNSALHMFVCMRSNDAFIGLPHDVFAFTMIQELFARTLNVELGEYSHAVGSLHLYKDRINDAKKYLDEGFQSTKEPMPLMPLGDPWCAINALLEVEYRIRSDIDADIFDLDLSDYWMDLTFLLRIHALFKKKNMTSFLISVANSLRTFTTPTFNKNSLFRLNRDWRETDA